MTGRSTTLLHQQIRSIRDDHRSGSLALTRKAAETLLQLVARGSRRERELRRQLILACRMLVAAQPQMAAILNLCNGALWAVSNGATQGGPARVTIEKFVGQFWKRLENHVRAASEAAAELLKDGTAVMTLSYSSMVRDAVLSAAASGARLRVLVTESRPLLEGVALAKELAAAGIPVSLGVDAMLADFVGEADLVLVGADAVDSRGVVNKIGTLPAVLSARELGVDSYALAVTEKFVPKAYRPPAEQEKSAAEVLRRVPRGVQVRNRYFEQTPLEWFTGVVTEEGVLRASQVRRRVGRLRLHRILIEG